MKRTLRRLAFWAQMPGNDFDKPWADWMLHKGGWIYSLWMFLIEDPLVWLACALYGHDFIATALNGDVICGVCLKGRDEQTKTKTAMRRT